MKHPSSPFKWRHFEPTIILLCVRWYCRYSLSYRDLEDMMSERGLTVDHTTVWRWVQRYAPEINKRVRPHLKLTGTSYRVDETYIKVGKEYKYLYRAVDKDGNTIEFMLSAKRDVLAAKRFFKKVMRAEHRRLPFSISVDKNAAYPDAFTASQDETKITLDGYEASHRAVAKLKAEGVLPQSVEVRTSRCLNNLVEQDHRRVKQRYYPMLGFKRFANAAVTLSGIELAQKIRKGQCDISSINQVGALVPQVWEAVLAA